MTKIDDDWPEQDLESVPNCPICGQWERTILYNGLQDYAFQVAEGKWSMYKCSKCGTAYLDPRPTPESIWRAYTNYYTHSNNDDLQVNQNKNILQRIVRDLKNGYINHRYQINKNPAIKAGRWIIPLIPPLRSVVDCSFRHITVNGKSRHRLLDVGCGNGSYLLLAREAGWDVEGLDFDPGAVKTCLAAGLDVKVGGIEIMQGRENFYDAITLSHVIEHVHNPASLLTSIYKLLKPGGQVWIETPNIDSQLSKRYGQDWRGLEPPRHIVILNIRSLYNSLKQARFRMIKQRYNGASRYIIMQSNQIIFNRMCLHPLARENKNGLYALYSELYQYIMPNSREFLSFTAIK